jgi:malic enzyme
VSTAVWAFIGVVVGGLLTVAAQATAELLKARAAARARQAQRERATREFQRDTVIELQAAMADYRAALVRDRSQLLPSRATDAQLSAARSTFQMLVHRVSSSPAREAALAWEAAALPWFQGDDSGTAAAEAEAWETAMRVTGEAVRDTD